MHGDVNFAGAQGMLKLFGEKTLAADLRQGPVEKTIARRGKEPDLAIQAGPRALKAPDHKIGLPASELRTARAQGNGADDRRSHAISLSPADAASVESPKRKRSVCA